MNQAPTRQTLRSEMRDLQKRIRPQRQRPALGNYTPKIPRSHIIHSYRIGLFERVYHATKGWRQYRIAN